MASLPPISPETRDALVRGQALHQASRHGEAARLLVPVAAKLPSLVDLQMMAGLSARHAGDPEGAIACFRRALDALPGDPRIVNILANTYASSGRYEEALALFSRILAQRPDFLDGHINRALTAEESGNSEMGLALIDESLRQFPGQPRLLAIRGSLLKNLDRPEEALDALDMSLAIEPDRPRTHLNRGVVLRALERPADALEAYALAEQHGIDASLLPPLRAAALLETGEVDSARTLYETEFASGLGSEEAGAALARIKREYLGAEDPLDHFAARAASRSSDSMAWLALLSARMEYRQWDRLRDDGRDALKRFPDSFDIALHAAMGEAWAGDRSRGMEQLSHLSEKGGESLAIATSLAELLIVDGNPRAAEDQALLATRLAPLDQSGWAWLSTAWRMLEDPREFWLCDYERLVVSQPVEDPDSPGAAARFAQVVATALDQLHSTRHAPGNQSLRAGTQTSGSLFMRRDEAIQRLQRGLRNAIARGTAGLPQDEGHPLLSRRRDSVKFVGAWSVRLRGGEGHHVAHYHSDGWMSSAYYARLPRNLGKTGAAGDDAGFIQFGAPPAHLGLNLPPRLKLRPEAGCLAMFPSYMWHGTVPFEGADTRLTAAFDFIPV